MQTVICDQDGYTTLPSGVEVRVMGIVKNPMIIADHGLLGAMVCTRDEEFVICHCCGGEFMRLNIHLRMIHQMTSVQYRRRYGLYYRAKLLSPQASLRARNASIELFSDPEFRSKSLEYIKSGRSKNARGKLRPSVHRSNNCPARDNARGTCRAQLRSRLEAAARMFNVAPTHVGRHMDRSLYATIRNKYGSWYKGKAKILGVPLTSIMNHERHWTRNRVHKAIKQFFIRHNRFPYAFEFDSVVYLPSRSTVSKLYGSLERGLERAKEHVMEFT